MDGGISLNSYPFRKKWCPQMTIKHTEINGLLPRDKSYKRADSLGLYLEIFPNGSKLWRLKYRYAGKEKRLAFGAWPDVTLAEARKMRDLHRAKLHEGIDPALERKREKATAQFNAANNFAAIANEYIDHKMVGDGRSPATVKKAHWFLEQITPAIGNMPITDIDPQMMLAALKRLEAKGTLETAKKTRSFASRVFRYGAATGRCSLDPTAILHGALLTPQARSYAAVLDPTKLGHLLRVVESFDGSPVIRFAMKILPHVYVRPGELRHAMWNEFDFEKNVWTIPEGKMKMRRPHHVALSRQVKAMFLELRKLTGPDGYVFPAIHTKLRPMSENTINATLRRIGFGKDEVTAHGFRSTASTLLNESGLWHPDAIERALAHRDKNAIRAVYNRGQFWDERVRMAQWWSDYLDELRSTL